MFGNVLLGHRVPNSTKDPLKNHVGTSYLCIMGRTFLLRFETIQITLLINSELC